MLVNDEIAGRAVAHSARTVARLGLKTGYEIRRPLPDLVSSCESKAAECRGLHVKLFGSAVPIKLEVLVLLAVELGQQRWK
jgi:hypothetical protein